LNEQQKRDIPFKKFWLFGEIVLVGFVALFLHGLIMLQVATNAGFLTAAICLFGWLPALVVGFIIFLLILRTKYGKFITLKSVTIFSFILALVIILPAISFYYETVPPKEITNQWHYDEDQEISEVLKWMGIHYDTTYANKGGYLYKVPNATQGTDFEWEYDESTQVITMTEYEHAREHIEDWKLLLRLDINLIAGSHYTMTTYYVSDVNFTLFNPLLFDNTTWKGSLLWDDQGK